MKKIYLIIFSGLFSLSLFAQTQEAVRQARIQNISIVSEASHESSTQHAEVVTDVLDSGLDFSVAQRATIYQINLDAAEKVAEIDKHVTDIDLREAKRRALFKDTTSKIMRQLKPEQQQIYSSIVKKSMQYKKLEQAKMSKH